MKYFSLLWVCFIFSVGTVHAFPVTVKSCGVPVTFMAPPQRAVFHDVNMTEMAFALHLQAFMRGVTGITGWNKETDDFRRALGDVPELAPRYPTLEQLMAAQSDLFVAGWNYGMRVGGDVTPERLASEGIASLVLTESCPRAGGAHHPITLDALLYNDEYRLGVVFGKEHEARILIDGWKARISALEKSLSGMRSVPVFLYDSGSAEPFTAGRDALVTELIRLAGGRNIFDDLPINWGTASWEEVSVRQPEVVVVVDYGHGSAEAVESLRHQALLDGSSAIMPKHIVVLHYDEVTPGPKNIDAVEALAHFLHPDAKW
ncbi:ABC transporter substrate-binding protein [Neokomagataea anthophila]|uniref:ABC transporter substrate-binding protein n=1 Tax=Neokomagataea anthophila TaxID=2826925 RepID=A0ABS5E9J2_9PROT|nr:ABC transporter substrate-binding protein [Neokomagataea anthophila]MBR0560562.1 ABC transporter substrate-binding protein [Neokomagataea anthophila]